MESKAERYLRIFQQISKTISTTLSVDQRMKALTEGIVKALEVKGCTVRLLDVSRNELELVASYGLSDDYFKKGPVDAGKSVSEALAGRTVIIKNVEADPRIQYPEVMREEGIVTIVTVPIIVKRKVIGVLKLHSAEEREFTADEIDFATSLAEQGGLAIENARLFENAMQEVKYLKAVGEVAKALGSTLEASKVLHLIVERAMDVLKAKACSLRLVNPRTKRLELVCSTGLSSDYLNKGPVKMDLSIGRTMAGEVVWIEDARQDARAQYPEDAAKEGIASILSAPVFLKGRVIGALRVYTAQPRKFSGSQLDFIQSMAELGALALENARLHEHVKDGYRALMDDIQFYSRYAEGL
jgi:signal transduction protein with GAF and PtsI domain